MAIRKITYNVTANGVTPVQQQSVGVQNERNVTELEFVLDSALVTSILSEVTDGTEVRYRFDGYDGAGGMQSTVPEILALTENTEHTLFYKFDNWITRFGGNITVCLVITLAKREENDDKLKTVAELYSYPISIRLKGIPSGKEINGGDVESITTLATNTLRAAEIAEKSAAAAVTSTENASKSATIAEDARKRAEEAKSAAQTAAESASSVLFHNGVYVGTQEPDDKNVNVWIDPDGEDSVLIGIEISETEKGHRVTVTDSNGINSFEVQNGKDGYVPIKGVDYYTDDEKALLIEEVAEHIEIDSNIQTLFDDFLKNVNVDYAYDNTTGAYYTVIRIYKQKVDGKYQYPFVYAPNGTGSGNKSTMDMVKTDGWFIAINGGVFDTSTNKPDGMLIQNGEVLQKGSTSTHDRCLPLTIDSNGDLGYAVSDASADILAADGIVSAVCGFMPIIVDYEIVPESEWNNVSHYTENAQRQIIGQWGNGDYAIITCEGREHHNSDGWTIAEAQAICQKHGLKFAYNLDGGGSTETMLGLKPINTIYENTTGRIVPTFIVFNGTNEFSLLSDIVDDVQLPDGYTKIPYVVATEQQYIVTDIPETDLYSIEYKIVQTGWDRQAGHILSSASTYMPFVKMNPEESDSTNTVLITKLKGIEDSDRVITGIPNESDKEIVVKGVYDSVNSQMTTIVNGTKLDTSVVGDTASESNYYTLLTYGGDTSNIKYYFGGRLYYLKLFNTDESLAYHFVPCINSSGVVGLYEVVNGKFYSSNSGVELQGGD